MYDLPDAVRVESDGPVRIVRLCRPDQLNAVDEICKAIERIGYLRVVLSAPCTGVSSLSSF